MDVPLYFHYSDAWADLSSQRPSQVCKTRIWIKINLRFMNVRHCNSRIKRVTYTSKRQTESKQTVVFYGITVEFGTNILIITPST